MSQEGVQLVMALLDGDGVRTSSYHYSSEASFRKLNAEVALPAVEELVSKLVAHAVERGYFLTA